MRKNFKPFAFLQLLAIIVVLTSYSPVFAYIGPGTGISAIGSFLALIAAAVVAVLGFIWFPLKRLFRKFKRSEKREDAQ